MLKADRPSRILGGLVKCALAIALLWAVLAQAQKIPCGPAALVVAALEGEGYTKTAAVALPDGNMLEAWQVDDQIALVILIRNPSGHVCCLAKEMRFLLSGQES